MAVGCAQRVVLGHLGRDGRPDQRLRNRSPDAARPEGGCTSHNVPRDYVVINSPGSIAGFCNAGAADFGPPLDATGVTGDVILGDDGVEPTSNGCEPFVNGAAVSGNIALVDRGACAFTIKVANAQAAGATGVLVADNVWGHRARSPASIR